MSFGPTRLPLNSPSGLMHALYVASVTTSPALVGAGGCVFMGQRYGSADAQGDAVGSSVAEAQHSQPPTAHAPVGAMTTSLLAFVNVSMVTGSMYSPLLLLPAWPLLLAPAWASPSGARVKRTATQSLSRSFLPLAGQKVVVSGFASRSFEVGAWLGTQNAWW